MLIAYTSSTQENSTNEKLILFIDIINGFFLNKKVNHNDSSYVQKSFTQKMLSQSVFFLFACCTRYNFVWANKDGK